jgi:hypothetical protein
VGERVRDGAVDHRYAVQHPPPGPSRALPVGLRAHPAAGHADSAQLTEGAFGNHRGERENRAGAVRLEADLAAPACFVQDLGQLIELGHRGDGRLLEENVGAGSQGQLGERGVGVDRGGEDDYIRGFGCQECREVGVDIERGWLICCGRAGIGNGDQVATAC